MSNISGEGTLNGQIFGVTDVIDYDNLTNRPKINNKVVEGEHNGRYYNLTESEIIDWINYEALPEATKKNGKIYYIRNVGTYEEKTISNVSVASFNDGSPNPLKTLKTDINPTQDLNGYEKPWAGGSGKNEFDYSAVTDLSGMSNDNGLFTNIATDTKTMFAFAVQQFNGSTYITQNMLDISTPGRYSVTFTVSQEITKLRIKHNGSNLDLRFDYPFTDQGTFTLSFTIISANPSIIGGLSFNEVMIESGSTATTYEPYANICPIIGKSSLEITIVDDITLPTTEETYEINLGQTIYGGKLSATTGLISITDGYIESYNGETLPSTWISDRDEYIPNTNPTIGAEVVYKLATPTTAAITPTEIRSLLGDNNIWTDSGNIIELIYYSPTGVIENQIRTDDEIFGRA